MPLIQNLPNVSARTEPTVRPLPVRMVDVKLKFPGRGMPTVAAVGRASADVVLFAGGLDESVEAEALDRLTVTWPGNQLDLIKELADVGKPLVVMQFGGGQVDDSTLKADDGVNAIVWAGYPDQSGGTALFDILTGKAAPQDAFPSHNILRTSYSITELVAKGNKRAAFLDLAPLDTFPVRVTNTGNATSDYVALLFVSGTFGPAPHPNIVNKQLVAYARVRGLTANGSAVAQLNVTPVTNAVINLTYTSTLGSENQYGVRGAIMESESSGTLPSFTASRRYVVWDTFTANTTECASVAPGSTFACMLPNLPSKLLAAGNFSKISTDAQLEEFIVVADNPFTSSLRLQFQQDVAMLLTLYPDNPALGSPFGTSNEIFGLSS
ncbi:hypothetical protein GSI_12189 [Ganoderma sinense ZZ0214-1]|uniref:Glycoside hydrolase family 3 C-terminal domain-containing protein n=1 Tax=Ganoderma sinense ZZ0214-1 TaxID=1077348 RepID=A0A2G8RY37_9APHY|nr:hypothetical protein GSI_12189 [Ganoderma sinense ZZ0214-1]